MLVAGFLLQNVPAISVTTYIQRAWSFALRTIALVLIILRAGLGLDVSVLRRLSRSIALLTFVPYSGSLRRSYIRSFCIGILVVVGFRAWLSIVRSFASDTCS